MTACLQALTTSVTFFTQFYTYYKSQFTNDWYFNKHRLDSLIQKLMPKKKKKESLAKLRKQEAYFTDVLRTKLFSSLCQLY